MLGGQPLGDKLGVRDGSWGGGGGLCMMRHYPVASRRIRRVLLLVSLGMSGYRSWVLRMVRGNRIAFDYHALRDSRLRHWELGGSDWAGWMLVVSGCLDVGLLRCVGEYG